jgi:hypothetical protein
MKLKKIMSILGLCVFAVTANAGILKIENPAKDSKQIDSAPDDNAKNGNMTMFSAEMRDAVLKAMNPFVENLLKSFASTSNNIIISNNYKGQTNQTQIPGAAKDIEILKKHFEITSFENQDAVDLDYLFDKFSSSNCAQRKEARLVWYSGAAMTYKRQSGEKISMHYSITANDKMNKKTETVENIFFDFSNILAKLAASDCHFVIGVDATSPLNPISLPRNVSVIWAGSLGSEAEDTPNGGALTIAFSKAMAKDKLWTANSLTAYLQSVTDDKRLSANFTKPWVQAANPDDTIYFPTATTPPPVVRVVPNYPTLVRKESENTR